MDQNGKTLRLHSQTDKGEIVLYQPNDQLSLEVKLENETVWLTQQQMAYLFGKSISTINEHIKDVFESKELLPAESMKKFGISEFQQKAHEKALAEYRKYQVRELTPVGAYLASLQETARQIKEG